jgi:hypothetical protein
LSQLLALPLVLIPGLFCFDPRQLDTQEQVDELAEGAGRGFQLGAVGDLDPRLDRLLAIDLADAGVGRLATKDAVVVEPAPL